MLRGAHAELRGWVLELFELQQTEATRAMLLMQLECERRLEGVSAAQAAVADAQAEKQSLDDSEREISELRAKYLAVHSVEICSILFLQIY